MTSLTWYANRLRRMSPREVLWRAGDQAHHLSWSLAVHCGVTAGVPASAVAGRRFATPLPEIGRGAVPAGTEQAVLDAADRLLAGQWELLGIPRPDIAEPDWFFDPVTGRRAVADRIAFRINHRDERQTGNVKQVWELSRLHHLTVLATAYHLTREERYAEATERQLRSWWQENPVLTGVHWTSGIELGIRLLSWVWIRRLLDGWSYAPGLFEHNDEAVRQVYWHQRYLATFVSRGSSANNHVIAETAGQLAAACAFPWFMESRSWRRRSTRRLERMLASNTFASGINRELASDYHAFVAELGLVAAAEAAAAGSPLSGSACSLLCRAVDAAAALLDRTGRPPRQGDGDDGRALILDDPEQVDGWSAVLGIGAAVFGRRPWWPAVGPSVQAGLVGALATRVPGAFPSVVGRPAARPGHFADAGLTLLRGTFPENSSSGTELWCRCDGGPHGMAGIAGHAHADALSVEFRVDGVDVLADPGTYCYHGEPRWRSYFRSTLAHNTVEIARESQSVEGGPFLWNRQARTTVLQVEQADGAPTSAWAAEHDGYQRLAAPARHRRSVRLDAEHGRLEVVDEVGSDSPHLLRMAFHLGPTVTAELVGSDALLSWSTPEGPRSAVLALPPELTWTAHRGEQDPILGWYSPRLGARVPATTLLGTGACRPSLRLTSTLTVDPAAEPTPVGVTTVEVTTVEATTAEPATAFQDTTASSAADETFSGSRR